MPVFPQPNSIGRRPAGYSRSPGLVTDAGRLTNAVYEDHHREQSSIHQHRW